SLGAPEYGPTNLGDYENPLQGWRLHFVPEVQWLGPQPSLPAPCRLEAGGEIVADRHSLPGPTDPDYLSSGAANGRHDVGAEARSCGWSAENSDLARLHRPGPSQGL